MAPKKVRNVIEKFKKALRKENFPRFKVVLFGSYARGEARPDSDIDLCLVAEAFKGKKEFYRKKAVFIAFEIDSRIQIVVTDPVRFKTDRLSPLYSQIRKYGLAA